MWTEQQLRVAAVNGLLGSIDANRGDTLLGWDTHEFPYDVYESTLCMYEVLKAGGLTGGFNFDAKTRRAGNTPRDMFHAYIPAMDTFAPGLIKAAELIQDGCPEEFVAQRYAGFSGEPGQKIRAGRATLSELAQRAADMGVCPMPQSGRREYLQNALNRILFR